MVQTAPQSNLNTLRVLLLAALLGLPLPLASCGDDGGGGGTGESAQPNTSGDGGATTGDNTPTGGDGTSSPSRGCLDFDLLEASAKVPSNITLLFSVKTCDGDPRPGLKADDFTITEDDATISAFESRQTILPRSVGFDLYSIVLLDMSGSIIGPGSIPLVQNAARTFIDQVVVDQRVAIVLFDGRRELETLVDFTDDPQVLYDGIDSLSDYEPVDPSTNLNGAVEAALSMLDREARLSLDKINGGSLILFTDGTDQASRVSDEAILDAIDKTPHTVFAVGLGEEVDPEHLGAIGKDGAEFAATEDIVDAFNRVAERLQAESQKYYVLGYCSPKRAGEHTLALEVEGNRGDLTYDFAADDFGPGCDPTDFTLRDGTSAD